MCSASPRQLCCGGLCQHPECWRTSLQRVREAVWHRNGIESDNTSRGTCLTMDEVYLTKEQRLETTDGNLPTLKVVDMFSDLENRIRSGKHQKKPPKPHKRSTSLPSLMPGDTSEEMPSYAATRSPHPSPAAVSALTEYQKKMQWKNQFINTSRAETASTRESRDNIKISTIGVHELYESDELEQDWQEVYVTSAYLVWCPTNKIKRKKRRSSSKSSRASSTQQHPRRIIPKDVTEDLVPAAMETHKPHRPKSTKTPTGGQPYSCSTHKAHALSQYGMEDISNLPKPLLSGILKRLNMRSNDGTTGENVDITDPTERSTPYRELGNAKSPEKVKDLLEGIDLATDIDGLLTDEEGGLTVHLAVDINSRFTTPEEDERIEEQQRKESEEELEVKAITNLQLDSIKQVDETLTTVRVSREHLPMNSIGVAIDDIPWPKYRHCSSSIPQRLSLGAALEPVNLVPISPSPSNESADDNLTRYGKTTKPSGPLIVDIPSGRAESRSTVLYGREDRRERPFITSAFRYSPSPVRAPAPTPISPDKYSELIRQSRNSVPHRKSSLQDDETSKFMRRWDTLSNVFDTDDTSWREVLEEDPTENARTTPDGRETDIESSANLFSSDRIFLTEDLGMDEPFVEPRTSTPVIDQWQTDKLITNLKEPRRFTSTKSRTPSPSSRTRIPKDIMEQFHGDLYGRKLQRAESRVNQAEITGRAKEVVLGSSITMPGWRPPRSRTPIQFSETPARFPPRPLRQPPHESVPKSLKIATIPHPNNRKPRPKSTPPRMSSPHGNSVAQVLSESSLVSRNGSFGASLEVHKPTPHVIGTGVVPPPPSPEATACSNELPVSNLETLPEEDERSSRTTSIAEFIDKGALAYRLSPVGGGSELSEESIDLPTELCEELEISQNDHIDQDVVQNNKEDEKNQGESEHIEKDYNNGIVEQCGPVEQTVNDDKDTDDKSKGLTEQQQNDPSSTREVINQITEELNILETDVRPCSPKSPNPAECEVRSSPESNPSGSLEMRPARGSPEPIQPSGSPGLASNHRSPEPIQPPGSPGLASNHDFTAGLDMELDLAAELHAAMAGLDGFVIDDDDDDYNEKTDQQSNEGTLADTQLNEVHKTIEGE